MQDNVPQVKVLHLITDLDSGGAEIMLWRLLSRMNRARFSNVVVSLTDQGNLGSCIQALGIPVHLLNIRRGRPDPRGIWRFWKILRHERPQVVQSWLYHAGLLGQMVAGLSNGYAAAWNIRCSNMEMRHYPRQTELVVRVLAKLSAIPDAVLVNSEAGRRMHEALHYRPRRWRVIPNGFDVDVFRPDPGAGAPFRKNLGLPAETLLIGLVARYDPMKDHRNFLEAAAYLLKDRPDVHFVLVGRGVEDSNLELAAITQRLNIVKNVHFLGERADIMNVMPALDIVTLSSAFGEGFPNVVGEAMASGVPCVVTDVGDAAMIVGKTGKVVPVKDPEALARAMGQLIDMGATARRRLGLAARRRIEECFSLPAVVHQYEQLYEELASSVRDRRIS